MIPDLPVETPSMSEPSITSLAIALARVEVKLDAALIAQTAIEPRLAALENLKHRLVGMTVVASAAVALLIEYVRKAIFAAS